ncbi:hypothetical protein MHBO_001276 [Bonamia ostreae]|uniref:Succinate dehydrogenase assembly factor 4, mitochondrial n=1 Tax=Bonamia ostreae TaxID=126728 RepID=A0ABV2AIE1_9EUKA
MVLVTGSQKRAKQLFERLNKVLQKKANNDLLAVNPTIAYFKAQFEMIKSKDSIKNLDQIELALYKWENFIKKIDKPHVSGVRICKAPVLQNMGQKSKNQFNSLKKTVEIKEAPHINPNSSTEKLSKISKKFDEKIGAKNNKQKFVEIDGYKNKEPTRYGDWELKGRTTDF